MWEKELEKRISGVSSMEAYNLFSEQRKTDEVKICASDRIEVMNALDCVTDNDFWRAILELERHFK